MIPLDHIYPLNPSRPTNERNFTEHGYRLRIVTGVSSLANKSKYFVPLFKITHASRKTKGSPYPCNQTEDTTNLQLRIPLNSPIILRLAKHSSESIHHETLSDGLSVAPCNYNAGATIWLTNPPIETFCRVLLFVTHKVWRDLLGWQTKVKWMRTITFNLVISNLKQIKQQSDTGGIHWTRWTFVLVSPAWLFNRILFKTVSARIRFSVPLAVQVKPAKLLRSLRMPRVKCQLWSTCLRFGPFPWDLIPPGKEG